MNGSFVIPAKYINNFIKEKIWCYHSIIGLAVMPWVILTIMLPGTIGNYLSLQPSILTFLILSGVIFGLGQVFFAYAIDFIGVALSFTINLGLGVTIGSLFVVFYKNTFFTLQDSLVVLAIFFILCSLFIYYHSGKHNNVGKDVPLANISRYHKGWLLASLTGLTSGLQNITFVIVAFYSQAHFQTSNSFWVWPPFLLAASIPMFIGFLYKIRKNTTPTLPTKKILFAKNILLITLMGLFFTGSLALYSKGMSQLSKVQQIIGWPAFMVSIILASQLWGWIYRESGDVSRKNRFKILGGIILLVAAIIILAIKA